MAADVFVVMIVVLNIGWIAVAAIRSNRREGATKPRGPQAEPKDMADGIVVKG